MTEKACKECHKIIKGTICVCGSNKTTTDWAGYVIIIDPEKSEIAKKMDITKAGKYALKVR